MLQSKTPKKSAGNAKGLNEFMNIAILYDATAEQDRKTIKKWTKLLSNRSVTTLGFCNQKLPLTDAALPTYNLQDINWYNLPTANLVDAFIKPSYDLVIFASPSMKPHMTFIFLSLKTKIAAGPDLKNALNYFDLIVESSSQPISTDTIIGDVIAAINKIAA